MPIGNIKTLATFKIAISNEIFGYQIVKIVIFQTKIICISKLLRLEKNHLRHFRFKIIKKVVLGKKPN